MRSYWRDIKLYLVLDSQVNDYNQMEKIVKCSLRSGVDIIQLRDKIGKSRDIIKIAKRIQKHLNGKIPFIINDRVDIALACQADGVHLGQDDLPVDVARKILGSKKIIGVSCQTLAHAIKAERQKADYIGFGSVYPTLTKPDRRGLDHRLIANVNRKISIPVFFIGGIDLLNVQKLCDIGIKRVAVTRAISLADNKSLVINKFCELLNKV